MVPPLENRYWTDWVERVVGIPGGNPREFPPSLFYCRLEDQPDHLVPEYNLETEARTGELVLNPACVFTRDRELPGNLAGAQFLGKDFALQGTMAWVPHGATGALQPFWLSEELESALARVRSGSLPPSQLADHVRKTLTMAGILVPAGNGLGDGMATAAEAGAQFRERGYAPVAGLIHPFHVAALRRYYRYRIRKGDMTLGDGQSPRRYVAHNENVARFFHHQLASLVTSLAGEPVKPSYVYSASYQQGAKLERHTDREQCEFSITFCLDYSPEPVLATGWPLRLHTAAGTVTVYQAIGDALLYRGRDLPHSRATLGPGHSSTSIFFHYVRENFSGPLD